jgi:hypothetical protein
LRTGPPPLWQESAAGEGEGAGAGEGGGRRNSQPPASGGHGQEGAEAVCGRAAPALPVEGREVASDTYRNQPHAKDAGGQPRQCVTRWSAMHAYMALLRGVRTVYSLLAAVFAATAAGYVRSLPTALDVPRSRPRPSCPLPLTACSRRPSTARRRTALSHTARHRAALVLGARQRAVPRERPVHPALHRGGRAPHLRASTDTRTCGVCD